MGRRSKRIHGERELRGERHGKGGRLLATAAASSFFILLLAPPPAAVAQWQVEVRAGVAGSSTLLEDLVATPRVAETLGDRFEGAVRARPAPGPMFTVAAATILNPRFAAELTVGWTATRLRATDATGTRELQDLGAGHATLGVRTALTPRVSGSVGFGALRYFAEEEGLFADGSDLAPLVEVGAAANVWRRLSLRAGGQMHRFSSPVIRVLSGQEGTVFRWSVQAGWAFGGSR